ncbi:hypothetical protein SARC_08086 [Sphaeroforma arctica JP610]|uniref:RING-type domain-containing protein n=1 Tax=Sphaeroforma arctica JP610 TaxID=667725 RepID=A0A0L0FUB5_9EUKA|nr:hypothetical protein SARC_08086 [Sphaeroforma arctica JP610]KNC79518.1 hypothetical protein SARC_08086 [Sphaeroforma arctica JP610]|eukprot:XP_014153420.1 hypothetical protein SARC_08086 [Sphaeroforma arctica JP610]
MHCSDDRMFSLWGGGGGVFVPLTHQHNEQTHWSGEEVVRLRLRSHYTDWLFVSLTHHHTSACSPQGHIACKECVYTSLLSQKKEYKRQLEAHNEQAAANRRKDEDKEELARQGEIKKFEAAQTSLMAHKASTVTKKSTTARSDGKRIYDVSKQNIWPDRPDQLNVNSSDRKPPTGPLEGSETSQVPEAGHIEADLKALPAFWIPGLTPDAAPTIIKKPTSGTKCTADFPAHPVKMKELFPVRFTPTVKGTTTAQSLKTDRNDRWQCPSCAKMMVNNPKVHVIRKCGHVICNHCATEYVKKDATCGVCSGPAPAQDVIPIHIEGTGFAGGGGNIVATTYGHSMG